MIQFLRMPQRSLYTLTLCAALLIALFLAVGESAGQTDSTSETESETAQQSASVAQPSGTLPGDPSIQLVKVADGLIDPVNIAAPNDGSGRVFIIERVGYIRILQDGQVLEEPFLDIRDNMKIDFLEQGLLGLAFHPEYSENGRFFVYYTDWRTNGDSFVVEFSVSDDDPNRADPESARVLLTHDQPYVNHNGGTIKFGPDGYLYIAMGDGGLAGDPYRNAQNLGVLLGSILRIDVDSETNQGYAIPEDNPFVRQVIYSSAANDAAQEGGYLPDARPEIWAYGLRNPWQFSFDRETGDLYIADVGQNEWEEINFQPADSSGGINYGWPILEGSHCYPPNAECGVFGELPVAEYRNPDEGCSITGIGIYRGEEFPSLDGIYFSSDFCTGNIWGLTRGENDEWSFAELLQVDLPVTGSGEDEAGNLYLTACNCTFGRDYDPFANPGGTVWRIVAGDQVPEGAETAPSAQADTSDQEEAEATPTPAPEDGTPTPTPTAEAGADQQATVTPSPEASEGEGEADDPDMTGDGGEEGDAEGEGTEQDGDDATGAESPDSEELIAMGEQIYSANCASCHQPDGSGTAAYPALNASDVVQSEDPTDAIQIVIHGRGQMPAFGNSLSDEEIAAVLSHERTAWDNDASPVDIAQVQQVRDGGSAVAEAGSDGSSEGQAGSSEQEAQGDSQAAATTASTTESASTSNGTTGNGSPGAPQTLAVPIEGGASAGQEVVIRIVISVATPTATPVP